MTTQPGSRRKGRESALQILYQLETAGTSPSGGQIQEAIDAFFVNFESALDVLDYASSLVRGVLLNITRIDEVISKHSSKWRIERMASVDRNVMRVATYELIFCPDLQTGIILDEAIEIAKRFGSEKSASFVNGILDSIAKDLHHLL